MKRQARSKIQMPGQTNNRFRSVNDPPVAHFTHVFSNKSHCAKGRSRLQRLDLSVPRDVGIEELISTRWVDGCWEIS